MVTRTGTIALLALVLFAGPLERAAFASGSYVSRPPQPTLIDAERYERGKAVFLGKLNASSAANLREAQLTRLQALQDRLPSKVRRSVDLSRLAGTISTDHVTALEYYLRVRFKVQ